VVNIKIIIEGGVYPGDNIDSSTFDNSEKFRESFHVLLSKYFPPYSFNLTIEQGAGNKQAIKSFKHESAKGNCIFLVDLDAPITQREKRLKDFELTDYKNNVFFMVQEMEAWIISQTEAIVKTYSHLTKVGDLGKDEIYSKHPQEINKPSYWLGILLGRYFGDYKNGIKKKKKYGKLKDAPLLIANLEIDRLSTIFEDVLNLKQYNKIANNN